MFFVYLYIFSLANIPLNINISFLHWDHFDIIHLRGIYRHYGKNVLGFRVDKVHYNISMQFSDCCVSKVRNECCFSASRSKCSPFLFQWGFNMFFGCFCWLWKLRVICQGIILLFTNSNKNLFFFIVGIPLWLMGYRINKLVTICRQTQKYIWLYIYRV